MLVREALLHTSRKAGVVRNSQQTVELDEPRYPSSTDLRLLLSPGRWRRLALRGALAQSIRSRCGRVGLHL